MSKRFRVAVFACLLAVMPQDMRGAYYDHRGHNVDSLLAVLEHPASAKDEARATEELMWAYLTTDADRSIHYGRQLLTLTKDTPWHRSRCDAFRILGQHYYSTAIYDSAIIYYHMALDEAAVMEKTGNYTKTDVDDTFATLYATIGNLYNIQDSVVLAEKHYNQALPIFQKYNEMENITVLCHNMGEMYMLASDSVLLANDFTGNAQQHSLDLYLQSRCAAAASGDSLMVCVAQQGLALWHYTNGYWHEAVALCDSALAYYSQHLDEEAQGFCESMETKVRSLLHIDASAADEAVGTLTKQLGEASEKNVRRAVLAQQQIYEAQQKESTIESMRRDQRVLVRTIVFAALLLLLLAAMLLSLLHSVRRQRQLLMTKSMLEAETLVRKETEKALMEEYPLDETNDIEDNIVAAEDTSMPTVDNEVPAVVDAVVEATQPETPLEIKLTPREKQVLLLLAEGKTNAEIAQEIYLSTETVKWYRKRLLSKFAASNTTQMVRQASERGLLG